MRKLLKVTAFAVMSLALLNNATARVQADEAPIIRVPRGVFKRIPRIFKPVEEKSEAEQSETSSQTVGATTALNGRFRIRARLNFKSPSIVNARALRNLGTEGRDVTIEGQYYEGSIPMIIDDIERVRVNMVLPTESSVPLSAPLPNVRSGDRVSLRGQLVENVAELPAEPSVLSISNDISTLRVLERAPKKFSIGKLRRLKLLKTTEIKPQPTQYAVLIIGGIDAANNHVHYWNEAVTLYGILRDRGYPAANIKVLYADGTARNDDLTVDFAATKANVKKVFHDLNFQMTKDDTLYVMVSNHGGGFLSRKIGDYGIGLYGGTINYDYQKDEKGFSEATYDLDLNGDDDKTDIVRFDQVLCLWGENMTDSQFAIALNDIYHYKTMIFQLGQCFSGGFLHDLRSEYSDSSSLTNLRRGHHIVMSACKSDELSWGDEFSYWYYAALIGAQPDGKIADADTDNDGEITFREAFDFSKVHNRADQTPLYSDNSTVFYKPRGEDITALPKVDPTAPRIEIPRIRILGVLIPRNPNPTN